MYEPKFNLRAFLQTIEKLLRVYKHLLLSLRCSPSDAEVGNVDAPDAEVTGQRFTRDVLDHPAVNDYVSGPLCRTTPRATVEPLQSAPALPRLFLHINRSLIDVKTDFVHQRA